MDSFSSKCQSTTSAPTSTLNRKRNADDETESDYVPSKKRRVIPGPINRKRKSEENDNPPAAKKRCFHSSFRYQNFSLPAPLIYYILKNPSTSKCYQKIIQSCKYFFIRNPILVIEELTFSGKWHTWSKKDDKYINLSTTTSKLWITKKIEIYSNVDSTSISSRIYRSDAKNVNIEAENIAWNDFLLLTLNAQNAILENNVIREGSVVPVEEIVAALPKIEIIKFQSTSPNITSNTVKKLLEIPHLYDIEKFELWNIPESFDIDSLFAYIKKDKYTKFILKFDNTVSEAYKNRVEAVIDEILETEKPEERKYLNYDTPCITFDGLDDEKSLRMLRYAD